MHHLLSNKYLDVTAWGKLYRTTLFKDIRFPIGKYHEDILLRIGYLALRIR